MEQKNRELLVQGAKELGVLLDETKIELIDRYLTLIRKWAKHVNLTGLREERDQVIKLIMDSLAIVPALETSHRVPLPGDGRLAPLETSPTYRDCASGIVVSTDPGFIPATSNLKPQASIRALDLGSGAGIPGIPVKIALPGIKMALAEPRQKRVIFLREAIRELGLSGIEVFPGRAEEIEGREFDYVLTKAFGDLAEIAGLSHALLGPGGIVIAMKGPDPAPELEKARSKIEKTGFRVKDIKYYQLPDDSGKRSLILLEKSPT